CSHAVLLFLLRLRRATSSILFPYTTLFRSGGEPIRNRVRCDSYPEQAKYHNFSWGWRFLAQVSLVRGPPARDAALSRRSRGRHGDRKSTRLNSSHLGISYAVFCLKKKIKQT